MTDGQVINPKITTPHKIHPKVEAEILRGHVSHSSLDTRHVGK